MLIITLANGIDYYVSGMMVRQVVTDASLTTIIALAIYLQFKNGRFDFSGGATMILSAIIAGNVTLLLGGDSVVFMVLSVVCGVVLSILTASVYIASKVPVIICTIGMTLLYESLTYVLFDAEGLSVISRVEMVLFGRVPYIFIPLLIVLALFIFFTYFTAEGRRAKLLSGNQKVAVSIGIRENKNVLITYIVCGVILGFGAWSMARSRSSIRSPISRHPAFFSRTSSRCSSACSSARRASTRWASWSRRLGMELLNYGLDCLGVGAGGYQQIIFGMFMLAFYAFSAQSGNIKKFLQKIFSGHKKEGVSDAH